MVKKWVVLGAVAVTVMSLSIFMKDAFGGCMLTKPYRITNYC